MLRLILVKTHLYYRNINFILYTHILIIQLTTLGKFSTKLTARKRYLPRIVTGVKLLNSVSDMKQISDEEAGSLVRAMGLYGASLRKGEYPDEISKEAQKLTDEFAKELKKGKDKTVIMQKLDVYLTFANLETSNDVVYK